MTHSLLTIITLKWLEVHDGINAWEKPAASNDKMQRQPSLQENQGLQTACLWTLFPTKLGKLVTEKVLCDINGAKHTKLNFGNGWVTRHSLIAKGAGKHMHYFKKTKLILSY